MSRYVIGIDGHRYDGEVGRDGKLTVTEKEPLVIFRGTSRSTDAGTKPFDDLEEAEKEAARLSLSERYVLVDIFELVETVKAAEPVDTATIEKVKK